MIRRPPRSTLFPYTDALPICVRVAEAEIDIETIDREPFAFQIEACAPRAAHIGRKLKAAGWQIIQLLDVVPFQIEHAARQLQPDRKSTRLNSSHSQISYAVFC